MESFTIELVSNASTQLFPLNTLSSFTTFLSEQLNLDGQWEVQISEKNLPINVPKSYGGKIYVFEKKFSKSSEFFYLEPGF